MCSVKGIPTYLTVRVNVRMVDENVNENPSIGIQEPPTKFRSILTKIGPGLIIAGSIVGSGELIATTSTGAEAGFTLLWLITVSYTHLTLPTILLV